VTSRADSASLNDLRIKKIILILFCIFSHSEEVSEKDTGSVFRLAVSLEGLHCLYMIPQIKPKDYDNKMRNLFHRNVDKHSPLSLGETTVSASKVIHNESQNSINK